VLQLSYRGIEYLAGDCVVTYDGGTLPEGAVNGLALDDPMLVFAFPGRFEWLVCGGRVRLGEDPDHASGKAGGGRQDPCGVGRGGYGQARRLPLRQPVGHTEFPAGPGVNRGYGLIARST